MFFINGDFNSRFFTETLYQIDILFYSEFANFFIMKEYWVFPNAEINKYTEMIIQCFSLTVLKDELQWLFNVKPILHSRDKNYLVTTNYPFCCSSVIQSYPILCNPMDCSMPVFPVLHHLPELAQTQVHWVGVPSNHLVLCRPLVLLPSIFPSITVFPNESVLRIRWPKDWSFSLSISPSSEYSGLTGLISLQSKGLSSLRQHHSSKASILQWSALSTVELSHPHITTGKTISE